MPISGTSIVAMLALFWGLVFLWFKAGLLPIIALAALADLALTALSRTLLRTRAVEIRRRNGS